MRTPDSIRYKIHHFTMQMEKNLRDRDQFMPGSDERKRLTTEINRQMIIIDALYWALNVQIDLQP